MTAPSINDGLAKLSNPTVAHYLKMMENTETPPIMHVWSLLSAASACLTRRKWFPMGSIKVLPNQYVMLVGPPGVRKSSSIGFMRKMLEDIPNFRFGPNNTAGRMQGLIAAMQGKNKGEAEEDENIAAAMDGAMADFNFGLGDDAIDMISQHQLNKSSLYVAESELVGFLGRNMDEFITTLGDLWDNPESYHYQLKREQVKVHFPCLNIIGGITPMHITSYLPAQAIGQGFSSRVVMVYEDRGKKVPWPEPIADEEIRQFKMLMQWIYEMEDGPFEYDPEVKAAVVELYGYELPIEDVRFIHYKQRRQSHVLKAAMALCALRMSTTVSAADIYDAHALLVLTEQRMPEALGEYGLSESALARARIGEVLKNSREPLTAMRIILACGSDVKRAEISRAVFEMTEASQIIELHLKDPNGLIRTGYTWPREDNPFRKHQEVPVSYMIDEEERRSEVKRARDATFHKSTDLLVPRQDEPDYDQLSERTVSAPQQSRPDAPAGGVMAKLASLTGKGKEQ